LKPPLPFPSPLLTSTSPQTLKKLALCGNLQDVPNEQKENPLSVLQSMHPKTLSFLLVVSLQKSNGVSSLKSLFSSENLTLFSIYPSINYNPIVATRMMKIQTILFQLFDSP